MLTNSNFKQCPNGHYYDIQLSACPYCDNQTYYKLCSNGHYFRGHLNICPYCGKTAKGETARIPDESECLPNDYIVVNDHYYMLNADGKTVSFICWSKKARDIYFDYYQFFNWYVEATLDDFNEDTKKELDYYDKIRIPSEEPSFTIPKQITYNGNVYPVVRIKRGAFAFCEIKSITIPDSIVYVEEYAFFRCDAVQELVIPNSVIYLAYHAISRCKDLKVITWQGITHENDTDEMFVFPDLIDKYAVRLNDNDHIGHEDKPLYRPILSKPEGFIPHCPHCGNLVRKSIPIVQWPIVGSIEGNAYDNRVPWNYQWDGHCESCGHNFNIKMAQDLGDEDIKRRTVIKVSGKSVPTVLPDAFIGLSGVEIEQQTHEGSVKMFMSTNELRFLLNALKDSPILEQCDWNEDRT